MPGAVGSIIGTAVGGPVGGQIGGALGGLIGGGGGGGGSVDTNTVNIGYKNALNVPGYSFDNGTLTPINTVYTGNPWRDATAGFLLGDYAGGLTTGGTTTTASGGATGASLGTTTDGVFSISPDILDQVDRGLRQQLQGAGSEEEARSIIEAEIEDILDFDDEDKNTGQANQARIRALRLEMLLNQGLGSTTTTGGETLSGSDIANQVFGGTFSQMREQVMSVLDQLNPLRQGIQGSRGDIQDLRSRVAPGFGELTDAAVQSVLDAGAQSIGNLRDSLSQRQVLGSSFANDAFTRTRLATGRAENEVRAQAKIAEIGITADLIQQELNTFSQEFQLTGFEQQVLQQNLQNAIQQQNLIQDQLRFQLEELRISGNIATASSTAATQAAIANAELQAAQARSFSQGLGSLTQRLTSGLFSQPMSTPPYVPDLESIAGGTFSGSPFDPGGSFTPVPEFNLGGDYSGFF